MATISLPQTSSVSPVQADEFTINYCGATLFSHKFIVQLGGVDVASLHEEFDGSLTVVPVGSDRLATTRNNRWTLRGALAMLRRALG